MAEHRAERRLVVKFVPERAAEAAELADTLAGELPGGRTVRVSRRGRALLEVDEDPAGLAERVSGRPEVDWAEPDTVDRAVDEGA